MQKSVGVLELVAKPRPDGVTFFGVLAIDEEASLAAGPPHREVS